jgi:plasmid stability protein
MVPLQNQYMLEDTMAVSLSIKNVSEETLRGLRARAQRNRRSLQKELLDIIETAAQEDSALTVDELAEYVKTLGISNPDDDTTAWIREWRDTRWASGTASGE